MKVILKQDVDALGSAGEVVQVKNGYGRNFLIPRGMAVQATPRNIKEAEENLRQQSHKLERVKNDASALAEKLEALDIVISAKVGEENRIFGTVTTQQVAEVLASKGLDIDRRKIELDEEIRSLGVYPATIKLHADVSANVKVQVVPE
ncbi:MAG: 50S ribosomal protein L9 [Candidatus Latescibacterota bacterium]|jgi:large subunit ribosomal protein L9